MLSIKKNKIIYP